MSARDSLFLASFDARKMRARAERFVELSVGPAGSLAQDVIVLLDEVERCWRELDEAKALLATAYDDFNGNGHPTNSWRKRVEDMGAWPKRTATS